jgi:hypothetical protein
MDIPDITSWDILLRNSGSINLNPTTETVKRREREIVVKKVKRPLLYFKLRLHYAQFLVRHG